MTLAFRETQEFIRGRTGERIVARFLQRRGWFVIPSYDYSGDESNKAPRLQGLKFSHVVPDLDVARMGTRVWIEVKTKKAASYTRVTGRLEHGIALRHYESYQKVQDITGCPVWLSIYEEDTEEILIAKLDDLPSPRRSRMKKGALDEGEMVYFPRDSFIRRRA